MQNSGTFEETDCSISRVYTDSVYNVNISFIYLGSIKITM